MKNSFWWVPRRAVHGGLVWVGSIGVGICVGLVLCGTAPLAIAQAPAAASEPKLPFLGYSGQADAQAQEGYTLYGPVYGDQAAQQRALQAAQAAGLPFVYAVGAPVRFHADPPQLLAPEVVRRQVTAQVEAVAHETAIRWWYVQPEEIRPWRDNEMEYLETVTAAIRAADPLGRPIWMYEPNHRQTESLVETGRFLDILGKGSYVNLSGYQRDRVWVRWSIEQQTQAAQQLLALDQRPRTVLLMPELCSDPADPRDDQHIPRWVRHDVYLGLISGAQGVAIWSLWPRPAVRRTYAQWRAAYHQVAQELTGPLHLGAVFLGGTPDPQVTLELLQGPRALELWTGARNTLETNTSSAAEQRRADHRYPPVAHAALRYRGQLYLFVCNSSAQHSTKIRLAGWPQAAKLRVLFPPGEKTGAPGTLTVTLGPEEVQAWIVEQRGE